MVILPAFPALPQLGAAALARAGATLSWGRVQAVTPLTSLGWSVAAWT